MEEDSGTSPEARRREVQVLREAGMAGSPRRLPAGDDERRGLDDAVLALWDLPSGDDVRADRAKELAGSSGVGSDADSRGTGSASEPVAAEKEQTALLPLW